MSSWTRALAAVLALAGAARAHDGPPYPIVVDRPLETGLVSVWADPDVGTGTFYVYLDPVPATAALPDLSIAVRPADGHVPEARVAAVPSEPGEPFQLVGEVPFDRRGPWEVVFAFGAEQFELGVEVTPPGAGRIDLLWFSFPFLTIAALWLKVFFARRRIAREPSPS